MLGDFFSYGLVLSLLVTFLLGPLLSGLRSLGQKSTSTGEVPGPWHTAISSFWFHWQRWNGCLTDKADELLRRYGNGVIVRLHPRIVLVNDLDAIETLFKRKDVKTGTEIVRALEIAGHGWTITKPAFDKIRTRRAAVQSATNAQSLRRWQPVFDSNIAALAEELQTAGRDGSEPVDVYRLLRLLSFRHGAEVLCGRQLDGAEMDKIDPESAVEAICHYNRLVAWRVCLPQFLVSLLDRLSCSAMATVRATSKASPALWSFLSPAHWSRRIQSSAQLFEVAKKLRRIAQDQPGLGLISQLREATESEDGLHAELAGTLLAASETTSSVLAFLLYELSRRPDLVRRLQDEVQNEGGDWPLVDACVNEALRHRGPVALTSSRIVPSGGVSLFGGRYFLPEGTVVIIHNSSLCRHRGGPEAAMPDVFDPDRWFLVGQPAGQLARQVEGHSDGRSDGLSDGHSDRLSAPFGFGLRRCPGSMMGSFTARLVVAALVRKFCIACPPETTDETMFPVERNGFRPLSDECRLIFTPRSIATH